MIANGYKLGVIAFILAHLCCSQSGVRGSSYTPVVSPDPIWCLVLSVPLSLKPWHAQPWDLLTTNPNPAPGFDGLGSSSRSCCDQDWWVQAQDEKPSDVTSWAEKAVPANPWEGNVEQRGLGSDLLLTEKQNLVLGFYQRFPLVSSAEHHLWAWTKVLHSLQGSSASCALSL